MVSSASFKVREGGSGKGGLLEIEHVEEIETLQVLVLFFVLSLLESKGGRNESGSSMRASANRSGESRGAVLLSQQVVPILLLLRVRRERVDR